MPVRRPARSPQARPDDTVLPEAEMEVLCVLHARAEAEAREVREALAPYRPMSHASVLTLLGRLEGKGLVWRQKGPVGKAYVYGPRRSASQVYGGLLRRILRRVFANDPARLVASLLEARQPTEAELGEIRALLDGMKGRPR